MKSNRNRLSRLWKPQVNSQFRFIATVGVFALTICGLLSDVSATAQTSPITGTAIVCVGNTTPLADATVGGSWSSGNSGVASVDATSGIVTGVASGTAVISYSGTGILATKVVTVNNVYPSSINGTSEICAGGSRTTLTEATTGGSWTSSTPSVATIFMTGTVTGVTAGTTTISYTKNGCSATFVVTVDANPLSANTGPAYACTGSNVTISNSTSGGTWSSSNTSLATINSTNGVVTAIASGTPFITYTVGGCFKASPLAVNSTYPDYIGGTTTVCVGNMAQLTETTTGGNWTSANPSVASVTMHGQITGLTSGTTTITYTKAGCSSTQSITVNSNTIPYSTGPMAACVGGTVTLSNAIPGGTWSSSNSAIATVDGSSGAITGIAAGSATIYYTVGYCYKPAGFVVSSTYPDNIGGTTSTCIGNSAQLTETTTGGTWTSGSPSVATVASTGMMTGLTSGTATITYTKLGCSTTQVVTVNANPLPVCSGPMAVCVGSTVTLSNSNTGGTWSSNNSAIASVDGASGAVTGAASGSAVIRYTLNGCYKTAGMTVNSTYPADIIGTAQVCTGDITTLSSPTTGGTWTSSSSSVASVPMPSLGNITGVSAGTATITYTKGGCSITKIVSVNTNPLSAISGIGTVCVGSVLTLSNTATGGTWNSANSSIATVDGSTGAVTGIATGNVYITYSDGTGCYKTAYIPVNSAHPAEITGNPEVCVGFRTALADITTGGYWYSSAPSTATVALMSGLVTGISGGTATITYIKSGCSTTKTVTVDVNSLPMNSGTMNLCLSGTTTLSNTSTGGTWSSSNTSQATVNPTSGVITGVSAGSPYITYTQGVCYRISTVFVHTPPTDIIGSGSVCTSTPVTFTDGTTGGTWMSNAPTKATVNASSGVVTGLSAGSATIMYSIAGCSSRYYAISVSVCRNGNEQNEMETANSNGDVFSIYPNPTSGVIYLQQQSLNATTVSVKVYNLIGQSVYSNNIDLSSGAAQIDLNNNKKGIYFIEIWDNNGGKQTSRFVIE